MRLAKGQASWWGFRYRQNLFPASSHQGSCRAETLRGRANRFEKQEQQEFPGQTPAMMIPPPVTATRTWKGRGHWY
jgi:hypothetical protein